VHVLVHVRIRRYCHLLRHPAKSKWHAGLLVCVGYANPCVDVQLAATVQVLDSKSADRKVVGVRPPLPAPSKIPVLSVESETCSARWCAVFYVLWGQPSTKVRVQVARIRCRFNTLAPLAADLISSGYPYLLQITECAADLVPIQVRDGLFR
jgi:hypothetical protein